MICLTRHEFLRFAQFLPLALQQRLQARPSPSGPQRTSTGPIHDIRRRNCQRRLILVQRPQPRTPRRLLRHNEYAILPSPFKTTMLTPPQPLSEALSPASPPTLLAQPLVSAQ